MVGRKNHQVSWILQLNDMRHPKSEILTIVARAETKEELETFLGREKVVTYKDEQWNKAYRQGGPLEWFNPPFAQDPTFVDYGLPQLRAEMELRIRAEMELRIEAVLSQVAVVPEVGTLV